VDGQADILQLLRHVGEIGVGDLAGQHFVAGADDLNAHAVPPWLGEISRSFANCRIDQAARNYGF
jgi:hypothetical protein